MDVKPVIIMGAGGHTKVLVEVLKLSGGHIIGLVAPNIMPGSSCFGVTVLGEDDALAMYSPDDVELVNGIGALPGRWKRWKVAARMRRKGFRFSQAIHPSAIISTDAVLGEGVQIMAGVVIQPGVQVGQDCILNTGVLVDHDCKIDNACHLAPGVTLSGNVEIGGYTHLGTNTSAIHGILIGAHSVVAAGSVVYEDIPDNVIFVQRRQTESIMNEI